MPNAALSQKLKPSKQLAVVLGSEKPVSRAEAVKGIWDYVKQHDLQNPEHRKITMFEVGKIVNSNLESEGSSKHTQKAA